MTGQHASRETPVEQDEGVLMPRPAAAPFVARGAELAWLQARWGEVGRGNRVLAAVEGDAGVGKATLVEVFGSQAAAQGALFVSSRSHDTGLHIPYQPLIELLTSLWAQLKRVLGPDLSASLALSDPVWAEVGRFLPEALLAGSGVAPAPAIEGRMDQNRLHTGLCSFLRAVAQKRPLVMALYDVQWADRSTLAFVHYLIHIGCAAYADACQPLMVILTYRPDELGDAHPLQRLLRGPRTNGRIGAANGVQTVQRLPLAPLSREAVGQWLMALQPGAAHPALAHYLWEGCEGNPLFLFHTLTDWLDRHPRTTETQALSDPSQEFTAADEQVLWPRLAPTVRAILERRSAGLSANGRQLLLVLAVSSWPLPLDLARRVLDWDPQTMQTAQVELLPTGLIWPIAEAGSTLGAAADDPVIGLSHSLVRRIIYDEARSDQARRLHRQLARELTSGQGRDDALATAKAALHVCLAGVSDEDVQPALMALAGWALSLNALDSARELYWAALSQATQTGDTAAQMLIHQALGDIHELSGDYRAGLEHYQAALGCASAEAERVQIRCRMAQVTLQHDEWEHAAAYIQAADSLSADLVAALPADLLTCQGEILLRLGQAEKAQRQLQQAHLAVEARGDVKSRIHLAHVQADLLLQAEQSEAALDLLQQALKLAGSDGWQIRTHERLGETYLASGRLAEAEHHLALALEGFQRLGAWRQQAQLLTVLSSIDECRGNLPRALIRARGAVVIYRMLERVAILTH